MPEGTDMIGFFGTCFVLAFLAWYWGHGYAAWLEEDYFDNLGDWPDDHLDAEPLVLLTDEELEARRAKLEDDLRAAREIQGLT